jgi:hypothetical protein
MWQWASSSKPVEELYDTQTDSDEVKNLADDPKFSKEKERLGAALEQWVTRIDDPLAADEMQVLRARVWPPGGKQPTTAPPKASRDGDSLLVSISCETPGASLGYRTEGSKSWHVYAKPFPFAGGKLEVVAHRLGWKPTRSEVAIDANE